MHKLISFFFWKKYIKISNKNNLMQGQILETFQIFTLFIFFVKLLSANLIFWYNL